MRFGSRDQVAVVGAGAAGLAAAWRLSERYDVTVYEAGAFAGGHALAQPLPGNGPLVDMGVMITLPWAYPNLHCMFERYGIRTRAATADFLACFGPDDEDRWGTDTELRQHGMFLTFAREASRFEQMMFEIAALPFEQQLVPLSRFVADHFDGVPHSGGYSPRFIQQALLPLMSLFVVTRQNLLDMPAWSLSLMFRFATISFFGPTVWRTIVGSTRNYVSHLTRQFEARFLLQTRVQSVSRSSRGVTVHDGDGGRRQFDQVVFATSAKDTLAMLTDANEREEALLGSFKYQKAHAYLHGDTTVLSQKVAPDRFFFQYRTRSRIPTELDGVFTYNMSLVSDMDGRAGPALVSLFKEPPTTPPANLVKSQEFEHVEPDSAAMSARLALYEIQGHRRSWFCGDYTTFNSHEDAFTSGMIVSEALGVPYPFHDDDAATTRYRQNRLLMMPRIGLGTRLDLRGRLELLRDTLSTVIPAAQAHLWKRLPGTAPAPRRP